jgi:hypothetical protein
VAETALVVVVTGSVAPEALVAARQVASASARATRVTRTAARTPPPMSPVSSSPTLAPEPLHSSNISRRYHHHHHRCFPIGANAPWSCGRIPIPSHFDSRRSSGSMIRCCRRYRRSYSSRGVSRDGLAHLLGSILQRAQLDLLLSIQQTTSAAVLSTKPLGNASCLKYIGLRRVCVTITQRSQRK